MEEYIIKHFEETGYKWGMAEDGMPECMLPALDKTTGPSLAQEYNRYTTLNFTDLEEEVQKKIFESFLKGYFRYQSEKWVEKWAEKFGKTAEDVITKWTNGIEE